MKKALIPFNMILSCLAFVGIIGIILVVIAGRKPAPVAQPISAPATSPFKSFIAGAGIVEAAAKNIQLSTTLGGVVNKVYVKVHTKVKAGDPLFRLDDRQAQADLLIKRCELEKAHSSLKQAETSLKEAKDNLAFTAKLKDKSALSAEDLSSRNNAVLLAQAAYEAAQADIATAEANLKASEINLSLLTITAPLACEVLQVNIRPGEYAAPGVLATPLMLLGSVDLVQVRVDIDENDAWRFKPGTRAYAYLRGNAAFKVKLKYAYYEPYVIPKASLTGDSTERVDTRVLQVIYSFDPRQIPVYVGQQMDVFIDVLEDSSDDLS